MKILELDLRTLVASLSASPHFPKTFFPLRLFGQCILVASLLDLCLFGMIDERLDLCETHERMKLESDSTG